MPLNVITDNVIPTIGLCDQFGKGTSTIVEVIKALSLFGYHYHLYSVICFSRYHIKAKVLKLLPFQNILKILWRVQNAQKLKNVGTCQTC
jgi:c-di-GMP-related signal transduction protein